MTQPAYDTIGRTYTSTRTADPRFVAAIARAIGDARSVVNVGAGTGSYEPADRDVVAVEPSAVMLRQRPPGAAGAVCGIAEDLPFRDDAFDVALGVLTLHHWRDQRRGLEECRRVARRKVVLLTYDPASDGFWLLRDYFPEIVADNRRIFPALETIAATLGAIDVVPLPIPADCIDGFLGAYWRRPQAYLDETVRAGISSLARLPTDDPRFDRLREDLASGRWLERNASLLDLSELDSGYRLVVSDKPRK